jgi:MoaA/NifB/PqqE/SkfB family radical SAM enzyme
MSFLKLLTNRIKIVAGLSEYQKTGKPKPIFAHLLLTNRCNLDCRYCFVDVNTIHKSDLQLEEWKKVILELYERGCVSITLMGGEPLLFSGLYDLVTYAKSLKLNIDLITNGIGIEKHIDTIMKIDSVMVSVDGEKEENDVNRGKRSFDYACKAIKLLKEKNKPVRINCVVTRQNKDSIPWLLNFAKENMTPVTFNLPSDFPNDAKDIESEIMLNNEEVREFYTGLLEYKRNDEKISSLILASEEIIEKTLAYPAPYQEIIWRTPQDEMNSKNTCFFGQIWIHINSNGDIYPCSQLWNTPDKFQPKNLRADGIDSALENARNLKCKSCFCLAPEEWRRTMTFKGMLKGTRITIMQSLGI